MQNKKANLKFKTTRHVISIPFILGMIVPLVFLDICLEIYHRISFPLYGLNYVQRTKYIKIDRHKLSYLDVWDKAWCAYCGYANGLVNYAVAIAGTTEKYWCGIKHEPRENFQEPAHHKDFSTYGDEEDYRKKYR